MHVACLAQDIDTSLRGVLSRGSFFLCFLYNMLACLLAWDSGKCRLVGLAGFCSSSNGLCAKKMVVNVQRGFCTSICTGKTWTISLSGRFGKYVELPNHHQFMKLKLASIGLVMSCHVTEVGVALFLFLCVNDRLSTYPIYSEQHMTMTMAMAMAMGVIPEKRKSTTGLGRNATYSSLYVCVQPPIWFRLSAR